MEEKIFEIGIIEIVDGSDNYKTRREFRMQVSISDEQFRSLCVEVLNVVNTNKPQ